MDPVHWRPEENNWKNFDRDVFASLETVGNCVFLSWNCDQLVGFASFETLNMPKLGIIGHNCILPEFRGQGFGKQQMNEVLDRLKSLGINTVYATTNDNPFFLSAQWMYKSCGLQEIFREPWEVDKSQILSTTGKGFDKNGNRFKGKLFYYPFSLYPRILYFKRII